MKLSVIIVNYNVIHFLEQCLLSVQKAIAPLDGEVFVVDNNSVDGSTTMVKEKFPWVHLIANKDNPGFSKANNQAIRMAKGQYILLLNPDTVVEEDTFTKTTHFMDAHPDAGGLGVMMVDGKGKFLPESKRGLPTPEVAFYRLSGLSKLFPHSTKFGQYHLSYLSKQEIHKIDVLSGAFMMMRKSALDKAGLLDETFFMYGEDIDLSYRITKAGFNNYYYPETRIIHYKGESTKKSSVNYVYTFYNAMVIFARKHFSTKRAKMFSFIINSAIWLRASLALLNRFIKNLFLPLCDASLLFGGLYVIKGYWEQLYIFPEGGSYPSEFILFAMPAYVLTWLIALYFSGAYDRPIQLGKVIQGTFIGTLMILVAYALLPEEYRFSRAIILMGTLWGILVLSTLRGLLHFLGINRYKLGTQENSRFIIIGSKKEAERVATLLRKTNLNPGFIGFVSPEEEPRKEGFIGTINQINDIILIYDIKEIIFCARDLTSEKIIDLMSDLGEKQVNYKIAPQASAAIIGSNSINTSGDLYTIDTSAITKTSNRRNKRLLDILICIFFMATFPFFLILSKKPIGFIRNLFSVLIGLKSWVGYCPTAQHKEKHLPAIKPGILNPTDLFNRSQITPEDRDQLNYLYAKDYHFRKDLNILIKSIRNIGS
ncbi:MAG: glycosyl transferase family 2 [Bacteroidetes bacterium]|nr:MAG: glycosyl transferase family 2 [Bacteroidota bacterium]PIE87612.1 MAG: glycosyl transferase family 2 [Bacteroidota bacterium]